MTYVTAERKLTVQMQYTKPQILDSSSSDESQPDKTKSK